MIFLVHNKFQLYNQKRQSSDTHIHTNIEQISSKKKNRINWLIWTSAYLSSISLNTMTTIKINVNEMCTRDIFAIEIAFVQSTDITSLVVILNVGIWVQFHLIELSANLLNRTILNCEYFYRATLTFKLLNVNSTVENGIILWFLFCFVFIFTQTETFAELSVKLNQTISYLPFVIECAPYTLYTKR